MRRPTVLIASTVGFAVLYLAATVALGSPPDGGSSAAEVGRWLGSHDDGVRTWLWLLVLASPLFAVYAALVRAVLPAPHRDVFLLGVAAFLAETAVQGWVWAALALHPGAVPAATAQLLVGVASYWGPVLTSTTVMMLGPVALLALLPGSTWPRWFGALAAVAVLEQLVETVTVFGRHGFLAPGGPMNVDLGAGLTAVTLVALGFVAARRQPLSAG